MALVASEPTKQVLQIENDQYTHEIEIGDTVEFTINSQTVQGVVIKALGDKYTVVVDNDGLWQ